MKNLQEGKETELVDLNVTQFDERDLLRVDPVRGTRTYMTMLPNGELLVKDVHPIGELMKHTDQLRSSGEQKSYMGNTQRHWAHVAEIPIPILTLWKSVLGSPAENPKGWAKRLNDPDNRKFRVDNGGSSGLRHV